MGSSERDGWTRKWTESMFTGSVLCCIYWSHCSATPSGVCFLHAHQTYGIIQYHERQLSYHDIARLRISDSYGPEQAVHAMSCFIHFLFIRMNRFRNPHEFKKMILPQNSNQWTTFPLKTKQTCRFEFYIFSCNLLQYICYLKVNSDLSITCHIISQLLTSLDDGTNGATHV